MRRLLRVLLRLHLRRPAGLWVALGLITAVLTLGVLRVERRLDLMSLLPTDNPVVRASIEAGVGQQELLWLAAEGGPETLEARQAWAEHLVDNLLTDSGMPLNGMSGEGRISSPMPVPDPKGAALWPPLLAAGSALDGDGAVLRLVTEEAYGLAPLLLGDRLAPLRDPKEVQRRLQATAKALASPEPAKAKLAQLDPLQLLDLMPGRDATLAAVTRSAKGFPVKLRTGYLETVDGRFVLVPLVLDFPSADAKATGRVLHWLGRGGTGPAGKKAPSHSEVVASLAAGPSHAFPLQATGAHAIAYWESYRLTREIFLSLCLSFALIGLVYWIGFRTLAGYGFVVVPLLLGMVWALGLTGWALGRLNLMAAAFGAVLLGIGDDVGILLFSRYRDERQAGMAKALALRCALLGTGPGVVAGGLATSLAFLACVAAPFPGFRDLGLTAGLGLLACMAASFLVLPALLLALDKGTGTFAPATAPVAPLKAVPGWKPAAALVVLLAALWGARNMQWEEDLRRFRQVGNPALTLQETLSHALGAGLQPLALQIPLDDPEHLPQLWNRLVIPLRREGLPMPRWEDPAPDLKRVLASGTWYQRTLDQAETAGLDPVALERSLSALRAACESPLAAPRAMQALMPPVKAPAPVSWQLLGWVHRAAPPAPREETFTLPLRLSEAAQERVQGEIEATGARMVGTRPLFRAIKAVARDALREIILLALVAVLGVVALFGRRLRFLALALVPLAASQIGVLGILGWTGEPLTFLSLVAIPIALGVSVDTAMNLLHRARLETQAAARVARVNAVCAGTTLAGFGGLVFSGYRGLRGLGLAALGGVALALLATQWVLPWLLEHWPLGEEKR